MAEREGWLVQGDLRRAAERMRDDRDARWNKVADWLEDVAAAWPWDLDPDDMDPDGATVFEDSLDSSAVATADAYLTAPDPAVQAESTGGHDRIEALAEAIDDLVFARGVALDDMRLEWLAQFVADRLAARDAVQAREVTEARADERERLLRQVNDLLARADRAIARLARAGGEGK